MANLKRNIISIIALIFAVLLMAGALVSCAETGNDADTTESGSEAIGPEGITPEDLSKYGQIIIIISRAEGEKSKEYTVKDFSEIGCVHVSEISLAAEKWIAATKNILHIYVEETNPDKLAEICARLKDRENIVSASPVIKSATTN